jgi:hypothetical protein
MEFMEKYITQLLSDIEFATQNVAYPFATHNLQLSDWVSEEEENLTAPIRNLQDWTGIGKDQLPPHEMLSDNQVSHLLKALNKMLDAYNCSFVLQTDVAERIQYTCIRENFDQEVKVKQWHMGFFAFCKPGTEHGKCSLGDFCQCAFYAELYSKFVEEDLTPEEERARDLEFEIRRIRKKYEHEWMKYYPYHLDKNYDDENGKPYNYGVDEEEEDDERDDWWRK